MDNRPEASDETGRVTPASYEAPRIETVLTDEDLAREVIYGGTSIPK